MSLFHLGCSLQEIRDKICDHQYQEPVGEDCPEELEKVINQCRAFDPFQRPSAERECPGHVPHGSLSQSAASVPNLPLVFHWVLPSFVFWDHPSSC